MHFAKLSEKQRQDHNTRDNRKLRRLKINWSQMQPAASSINFYAYELRHDEKDDPGQIHRKGAPADPAVMNQTRQHECENTHGDPVRLLVPEIRRVWVGARGGRAVDRQD